MSIADAIQQAARNSRALTEAARTKDAGERERAETARRARERADQAAIQERAESNKPKEFPVERVPWGVTGARDGKPRTLGRFVHQAAQVSDNQVGRLCRLLQKDNFDLADPTTLIRRLALRNAPAEWLAAARELIAAYRAWELEGFESEIREVERINPARAAQIRESLAESREIADWLFQQDRDA